MCDVAQNGVGCRAAAGRVSRAVGDSWDFAGGESASVNEQYEASATAPNAFSGWGRAAAPMDTMAAKSTKDVSGRTGRV